MIGEVTDHGELRAFFARRDRRRDPGRAAHRRVPALRARADAGARRRARRRSTPVNDEPKTWVFEQYDQLVGSRTVRRPGLDAAVLRLDGDARHRRLARRPAARRARPVRGRLARGDGRRAQRRLRRRRADRAHRLPQLRQPGAARDRLGARPGDRRDRGGRERARDPGRLRQRLALQRDRRPADPADAGRRLRRPRPRRDADSRRAGSAATASALLRGEGAGLVRFVWQNAHRFSLAHDVSDGGVALALREAAAWSGSTRRLDPAEGAGVIVALAPGTELPWDDVVELGLVPDVRRLRHPRTRPRRRAAHLLRPATRCSTAARSRPGSPSPSTAG